MPDSKKPQSSSFEGDFAPGQVLIGRYRIVALLGEGGMGQVYLADDVVLGEPVAVKFLPAHVAQHEGGLERFRAEVRHAREVTHPNVARVHDIGEVEGRHFLTMEFVDGEDLASLIRRIGRLPSEKAAEIGQQICAGLAEAHRKGVLHRDLKPANVMLDGEGRARLTDFGLAVPAGADAPMAGTPPYMAPEQLAGLPASVQSEVYSLGLVLYELYTGKRALRGRTLDELRREHEEGPVEAPSSVLADIDERVERVLTRCLARDPKERPASVQEVARALPGGDPLAAALAAGVTPSPEVVAAAGTQGALAPRPALGLLVGALLLLVGAFLLSREVIEKDKVSYGKPAAVLRERAREMAADLAEGKELAHEIHWYGLNVEFDAKAGEPSSDGPGRPAAPPLIHSSRFGPEPVVSLGQAVSATDPAPVPGSVLVVLDAEGILVTLGHFLAAEEADAPDGVEVVPEDVWAELLERAGFESRALRSVEPETDPPVFATERRAWKPAEEVAEGGGALRIEAAGVRGRPVYFAVLHDGKPPREAANLGAPPGPFAWILMSLTTLAAILAWRNVRGRRADVGGGLAVGIFALVTHVVLVFGQPITDDFSGFGTALFAGVSYAIHTAVRVTVFYMALEPFARRRWPRTLITWSRLLEGRLRDPSVGREILIGMFVALVTLMLGMLAMLGLEVAGVDVPPAAMPSLVGLEGPLQALSNLFHTSGDAVMFSGMLVFVLVLLRSLVSSSWLGNGLWLGLILVPPLFAAPSPLTGLVLGGLFASSFLLLLTRAGFLSAVVMLFVIPTLLSFPLTLRPADWYFSSSLMVLATFALLATWAYRVAVAGQSVFEADLD